MKNAIILHGTDGSSQEHWFQWLKGELERRGWKVWTPDLPQADRPNIERYNKFLLESDWIFDEETVLIGHSSGAVAVLGLLEALPNNTVIDTAVLVGSFKDNLNMDALMDLGVVNLDYGKIKTKARRFIFFHSDNDPYCPLDHAEFQADILDGELITMPGEAHFSISTAGEKYKEFPELLAKIT